MASAGDDLDLIGLFGLSADEAVGLGLDQAASVAPPPGEAPRGGDMGAATDRVAAASHDRPTLAGAGRDPFADELALLSMLGDSDDNDSPIPPSAAYNAFDGRRDLSAAAIPLTARDEAGVDNAVEDVSEAVSAGDHRLPEGLMATADSAAPTGGDGTDIADIADIAALFGLSGDEASALGLDVSTHHVGATVETDTARAERPTPESAWQGANPEGPSMADAGELRPVQDQGNLLPEIDPLLLDAFAEESGELLEAMHVELESLEANPDDRGALLEIRRIVHTVKGGAKMCRFERVGALAHACENLLDVVADGDVSLDQPALHALFACEPLLRTLVQDALAGDVAGTAGAAAIELAAHFDALCAGLHADANYDEGNIAAASAPTSGADACDRTDERDGVFTREGGLESADLRDTSRPEGRAAPDKKPTLEGRDAPERSGRRGRESISVDLSKVDAVVAKVTEMAAHRSSYQGMVGQLMETTGEARHNGVRLQTLAAHIANECLAAQPIAATGDENDLELESYNALNTLVLQLQEAVADQQALVEKVYDTITNHWSLRATEVRADADLQNALMNIRLIPIATMRIRLDGVIRQAAQATGKSVNWRLQGGGVAVEKNVYDRLFEPLMHLLRNAVDHGLEGPEGRLGAGKAEAGAITVTAKQEDNHVVITVADDGAGIAPDKIAAVAVERGVITAGHAARLSARQKMELIFTPGFSTAGSVSHLSGRGVGMDAVREACLRMGGAIDVESMEGQGTTFTLRLPLSLSVTRGLIIRDGGCYMAVPVGQIAALHLVPAADLVETPTGRIAHIDGHDLPVYNLPPLPGAQPAAYVRNGEVHVLQVPHEGGSIGLLIEDVLDEEEMLIKAPPPLLRGVKTLMGSYVLSDGAVAPVINLPWMLAALRPASTLPETAGDRDVQAPIALVVDDSLSMRVALNGTLQGAGFTVLTARDGQEALDILKREGLPALITLDIEMPRMDGLETLFAIRQMPRGAGVPVFMLTSRGGAKHRRAAEQLGATRYFTKPYRDAELAAAARAACALA